MGYTSGEILNKVNAIFKDCVSSTESSELSFNLVLENVGFLMDVHSDGSSFLGNFLNSVYKGGGRLTKDQMGVLFAAAEKTFKSKKYISGFHPLQKGESNAEDLIDFIFHFTYVVDENKIDLKGTKSFFTNIFLKAVDNCFNKISGGYGRNDFILFILKNDEKTRKLGFSWDVDDLKKIYDIVSYNSQKSSSFNEILSALEKNILYKRMSGEIINEVGSAKKIKI